MNIQKPLTLALGAALFATAACDDDSTAPEQRMLVGDLEATRAEFVSTADPDVNAAVVADGGSFTVNVDDNGLFESRFDAGQGAVEVNGSVAEFGDGRLRFSDSPFMNDQAITEREFFVTRQGGVTTLSSDDVRFDFDGNGVADPATVDVDLAQR